MKVENITTNANFRCRSCGNEDMASFRRIQSKYLADSEEPFECVCGKIDIKRGLVKMWNFEHSGIREKAEVFFATQFSQPDPIRQAAESFLKTGVNVQRSRT